LGHRHYRPTRPLLSSLAATPSRLLPLTAPVSRDTIHKLSPKSM